MPYRQEFSPESGMLYEHWSGSPDRDEVFRALAGHTDHPGFAAIRWILSDERAVTNYDFSSHDVKDLARSAAEARDSYRQKKWAIVIDEARATALALLFRQLLEKHIEIQIFSSLNATISWLDPSSQAREHLDACVAGLPGERH